jgi:hypothetical protein
MEQWIAQHMQLLHTVALWRIDSAGCVGASTVHLTLAHCNVAEASQTATYDGQTATL